MGKVALAVSVVAVVLCATIWFALVGAPLGLVSLVLGIVAVRRGRRDGQKVTSGWAAIVLSTIAVLSLPVLGVACNSGLSCV